MASPGAGEVPSDGPATSGDEDVLFRPADVENRPDRDG